MTIDLTQKPDLIMTALLSVCHSKVPKPAIYKWVACTSIDFFS